MPTALSSAAEQFADTSHLHLPEPQSLPGLEDGFTGYRGWEQVLRMQQTAMPKAAE